MGYRGRGGAAAADLSRREHRRPMSHSSPAPVERGGTLISC
ncbi:hypothetical protein SLI_1193 [Streptomyces lividans 1326]|uniref:Uncharacterized protein n=1 Tax=Streptomyces lividans 1326 TaxID=1200984 RepID=A0A7U9H942_STRLI|nr:hypothetical protein SLI_1193 [Streptomyces lividans 1326]